MDPYAEKLYREYMATMRRQQCAWRDCITMTDDAKIKAFAQDTIKDLDFYITITAATDEIVQRMNERNMKK